MTGVIINCITVIIGSLIGMIFKAESNLPFSEVMKFDWNEVFMSVEL